MTSFRNLDLLVMTETVTEYLHHQKEDSTVGLDLEIIERFLDVTEVDPDLCLQDMTDLDLQGEDLGLL